MKALARLAALLLALVCASHAWAQPEVGSYPNASTLQGNERLLGDQAASFPCTACTVNVTPQQIGLYINGNSTTFFLPLFSGSFTLNDCVKVGSINPVTFVDSGSTGCGGGSTPSPPYTSLQFNNSGVLGGTTGLTWTAPTLFMAQTLAASEAAVLINVPPYTGGTSTTNWPVFYFDESATAPTTWSTAGTEFGMNAPSGFIGNLLDFHLNGGASLFSVNYVGSLTAVAGSFADTLAATESEFNSGTDGVTIGTGLVSEGVGSLNMLSCYIDNVVCTNFSLLQSGTNTSATMTVGSGAAIGPSGIATGTVTANALIGSATASLPTCNSGAEGHIAYTTDGTPALVFCNGTSWVGGGGTKFTYSATGCTPSATSGTATSGSITLASGPCTSIVITMNGAVGMTAPDGWTCNVGDRTAQAAGTWIPKWGESASSTTTATLPIPSAAGSTDVLTFTCSAY